MILKKRQKLIIKIGIAFILLCALVLINPFGKFTGTGAVLVPLYSQEFAESEAETSADADSENYILEDEYYDDYLDDSGDEDFEDDGFENTGFGSNENVVEESDETYSADEFSTDEDTDTNAVRYTGSGGEVYITHTGKRYHNNSGCQGLSNANEIISSSEADAISRGFTRCKLCY